MMVVNILKDDMWKSQLHLSYVAPEPQNGNNEGDHRTCQSLKLLNKQNGFSQWGVNFLSCAVQAEDAQPLARGPQTGGCTGRPPGPIAPWDSTTLAPFPDSRAVLLESRTLNRQHECTAYGCILYKRGGPRRRP